MRDKISVIGEPIEQGIVTLVSGHGKNVRGLNGFDPNASIAGLEHALKNMTLERAAVLWNALLENNRPLQGYIERAKNKDFRDAVRDDLTGSKIYNLCSAYKWLPDKQGMFHQPHVLTLAHLPQSFESQSVKAKLLSDELSMKPIDAWEKEKKAKEFEEFMKHRPAFLEWQRAQQQAALPESTGDYSPERGKKLQERQQESRNVEYKEVMRSIRVSSAELRPRR